jgi:hypothetical protein
MAESGSGKGTCELFKSASGSIDAEIEPRKTMKPRGIPGCTMNESCSRLSKQLPDKGSKKPQNP